MKENNQAFLQINNLEKIYPNGEKAVYKFNLDIHKNEFIVIVGPSGCGKSTTLRMIAGLEDISAGEVYMDGELLNYKPCKDRKMAIVFQSYALYPQMTVYDNIAFPLTINKYPFPVVNAKLLGAKQLQDLVATMGFDGVVSATLEVANGKTKGKKADILAIRLNILPDSAQLLLEVVGSGVTQPAFEEKLNSIVATEKQILAQTGAQLDDNFQQLDKEGNVVIVQRKMTDFEIRQKVFATADVLDLTQYLDKLPKELSGGQMQRVALGRAIVKNVPVFLMDEPLSNLDAKLRLIMRSEIVKLHNKINATTLYVTHDQTEAMTMATRIVVMSRGFVQQIGTPEEVYNNPANIFIARFIGSPSMNVFELSYDATKGLVGEGVQIPVEQSFATKYAEFYRKKQLEFEGILQNFDEEAKKYIRKVLSAIDQQGEKVPKAEQKKSGLFARLFRKKQVEEQTTCPEQLVAEQKYKQLQAYANGGQKLLVGIRPERIHLEKYDQNKSYPQGATILQPVLCELLGAEYNVHFTYCGKNMVGKIDAKEKITHHDKVVVTLSFEDIYVFDPITGEVI